MTIPPEYERLPNGTLHRIDGAKTDYKAPYWGVDGHSTLEDQRFNVHGYKNENGVTKSEFVLQYCWGELILEVGCSPGAFMKLARGIGFQVEGVEPNKELAEEMADYTDSYVWPGLFSEIDFGNIPRYDTIVAMDVLEHLEEPEAFVEKAMSLLIPGGRLILMIPALLDDGLFDEKNFHPEHLNIFSEQHLREWLNPSVFDRFCTGHEIVVVEK